MTALRAGLPYIAAPPGAQQGLDGGEPARLEGGMKDPETKAQRKAAVRAAAKAAAEAKALRANLLRRKAQARAEPAQEAKPCP
jgi:hypothetical protein